MRAIKLYIVVTTLQLDLFAHIVAIGLASLDARIDACQRSALGHPQKRDS